MSGLFGSLYSSVSGMKAGSTNLAAISDNISNLNTVGYKGLAASFSTLVTTSGSSGIYSSGGVMAKVVQGIDASGTQIGTGKLMDIAVTGGTGMIPVNSKTDGTGESLFTRIGDFYPDSTGTYRNDNGTGFALMGWKLDTNERLPGEFGNIDTTPSSLLQSLQPINFKNVNGSAGATTEVKISGNLKQSQAVLEGVGGTIKLPNTSLANTIQGIGLGSKSVIIPESNGIYRMLVGDEITLTPSSVATTYTYIFGGMTSSMDITAGLYGVTNPDTPFANTAIPGWNFTISTASAGTLTFTYKPGVVDPTKGEFNSLTSLANAINEIAITTASNQVSGQLLTARVYNGTLYVAPVDASEAMTINDVVGTLASDLNLGSTTQQTNRFATLEGLANLIDNSTGLQATVESPIADSQIKFFATDPLGTLTMNATHKTFLNNTVFTSGVAGTSDIIVTHPSHSYQVGDYVNLSNKGTTSIDGITFPDQNYQITSITANSYTISGTAGTATLGGVSAAAPTAPGALETDALGPAAFATGAVGSTLVTITHANHGYADGDRVKFSGVVGPINGITINNGEAYTITVTGANTYTITATTGTSTGVGTGGGSSATVNPFSKILRQLNLTVEDKILGPSYDATAAMADNMAGGRLKADYSMNTRIYDSFGSGHDIIIGYIKIAPNTWAIEGWATDPSEIVSSTGRTDGQLFTGNVTFNGDGTLRSLSSSLSVPMSIVWSNGSVASNVTFNWGTAGALRGTAGATIIGLNDGLGQVDADYSKKFIDQNGYAPSDLRSVQIDESGYVIANFKNGQAKKLFKVPLVEFTNVNGLEARTGNAYAETYLSGTYNLREADTSTVGKFSGQHLEQATVELSNELTNMIIAQKGYQASARVIKTVNELLDELNRAIS